MNKLILFSIAAFAAALHMEEDNTTEDNLGGKKGTSKIRQSSISSQPRLAAQSGRKVSDQPIDSKFNKVEPDAMPPSIRSADFRKLARVEWFRGKGWGLVAEIEIEPDTEVLREIPLVSLHDDRRESETPKEIPLVHLHYEGDSLTPEKIQAFESSLQDQLNLKGQDARDQYQALHNRFSKDQYPPLYGIFRTNVFTSGVFLDGSRFNHSCNRNIDHYMEGGARVFFTTRRVQAGQELTLSYTRPFRQYAERQKKLLGKGISCNCIACELTGKSLLESDARRCKMGELRKRRNKLKATGGDKGCECCRRRWQKKVAELEEELQRLWVLETRVERV